MNWRLYAILSVFIFITVGRIEAQKKYDKALQKADKQYNAGNYAKALSALNSFRASVTSGLGASNPYMVKYHIRDARFNLAYGMVNNLDQRLNNAIDVSKAVYGENTLEHANTLVEVGEIYNQYGYFRLSNEVLSQVTRVVMTADKNHDALRSKYILAMAEAQIGQGYYDRGIALLRSNEEFIAGRATTKEVSAESGKLVTRQVPAAELLERYTGYARMLSLITLAYGKKGDIDSMDISHSLSRPWLTKNLKTLEEKDIALILVQADYIYTRMYAENNDGDVPPMLPKYADYGTQLAELKKTGVAPSIPLAHDIYLSLINQRQREDNKSGYVNTKAEYERMLNKYFKKESVLFINLKSIEFDSRVQKDKITNIESDALSTITSKSLPRNHPTTLRILDFMYAASVQGRRYNTAESYLLQANDVKKELYGEEAPMYHLARIEQANFFLDYTNKIEEAGKIYTDSYVNKVSKEIHLKHKDHLIILSHLANYYELTDRFNTASETLSKASDAARVKFDSEDPAFAIALNQQAKLRIKLGDYEKAEADINRAITVFELKKNQQPRWQQDYINTIETQAKLYGIKGLFDEAQANLDRTAKMIAKSKTKIDNELSTAEELSSLLIQLGAYSRTNLLLDKLIPEYVRIYGNNSVRLIDPYVNRGKILLARGDYTEAERTAIQANQIALLTYGELSTKTAGTQRLLSDIYYSLGDYDKAEDNIRKALSSQEKQFGRNHVEVARSLSQLALIKFYDGDDRKLIEQLMIEARDIIASRLGKDNPQYAEILKNFAQLYISDKRYDLAFNSLAIAESIWVQKAGAKNNINLASIYMLTGDVYYQMKNYSKAEEFYNKSRTLYEKNFSITHPEYVRAVSRLSKVHYMQKDYKKAKQRIEEALNNYESFIKQFFPALSEREKAKYWNTIKSDFEFYNTLAFSQLEDFRDLGIKVYNYQLLTKALLLSSSIKIRERIMNSTDDNLKFQFNQWVEKKEMLTLALSLSPAQLLENGIDQNALRTEVERLEKDLSQRSELFGQSFENKRITFEEVKKSLKANEVALEIVRYRHFDHVFTDSVIYAVLAIKNDSRRPEVILMANGKHLEGRYFRYFNNTIQARVKDENSYRVYWEPIQQKIGNPTTIYLSADGVYNQINLESIAAPDGRYIMDNANIVYISNTKDLYLQRVKSRAMAQNNAAMFGNPAFYLTPSGRRSIPPLPGTEREVNQLQYLLSQKGWKTEQFLEQKATEEQIKEVNSPRIFHIATHGFYRPSYTIRLEDEMKGNEAELSKNPLMRNGLLLKGAGDLLEKTEFNFNMENGILTAYEAMNLNLDQTDLVVLSACETGLGDLESGEGVYGLQRAFLVAGARVLVMSMFKVDDEATQKLMLKFYQKWLNTNNLRQSFTDAKKELREEYPDPYYWGAFMMIGLDI